MSRGVSLHIGVNSFDPDHYGSDGKLKGCENDAHDMQSIADSQGFETHKLLTTDATRANVITALRRAAFELKAGDIFFISYSGHGGRIPDRNKDEDDLMDETWCLYDGQLIDDELQMLWSGFKAGTRILVTSDSCHSGTVLKPGIPLPDVPSTETPRFLPYRQAEDIYRNHRAFYDELQVPRADRRGLEVVASVRLMSGCQDDQYSYDGADNGAFTGVLKRTWADGSFKGNYHTFHQHILAQMPGYQSPNYWEIGAEDPVFAAQKPFAI